MIFCRVFSRCKRCHVQCYRKISIEEGYDPANHDLVAFGGAGGQHACGVAELMGMNRILLPADSGLLSAYGLSRARVQRLIESPVMEPLAVADIFKIEEKMILSGKAEFSQMGEDGEVMEKRAFIRLVGQDSPLEIIYQKPDSLASKTKRSLKIYLDTTLKKS